MFKNHLPTSNSKPFMLDPSISEASYSQHSIQSGELPPAVQDDDLKIDMNYQTNFDPYSAQKVVTAHHLDMSRFSLGMPPIRNDDAYSNINAKYFPAVGPQSLNLDSANIPHSSYPRQLGSLGLPSSLDVTANNMSESGLPANEFGEFGNSFRQNGYESLQVKSLQYDEQRKYYDPLNSASGTLMTTGSSGMHEELLTPQSMISTDPDSADDDINMNFKSTDSVVSPGSPFLSNAPLAKIFKCSTCSIAFARNHDLRRHMRIHLEVKPFPCNHCDKSFARKDALKRHQQVKNCRSGFPFENYYTSGKIGSTGNENNETFLTRTGSLKKTYPHGDARSADHLAQSTSKNSQKLLRPSINPVSGSLSSQSYPAAFSAPAVYQTHNPEIRPGAIVSNNSYPVDDKSHPAYRAGNFMTGSVWERYPDLYPVERGYPISPAVGEYFIPQSDRAKFTQDFPQTFNDGIKQESYFSRMTPIESSYQGISQDPSQNNSYFHRVSSNSSQQDHNNNTVYTHDSSAEP